MKTTFPGATAKFFQPAWQAGRRVANSSLFRLRHPEAVVLHVKNPDAGQFNQPYLLDFLLDHKTSGFFLDIGANHPSYNSNSFFFESQRSFTGIAFDPLRNYAELWSAQRPGTKFLNIALGETNGEVQFFEHQNDDGWADQLSYTANSKLHRESEGATGRIVTVQRLDAIEGMPSNIDFASIDVEGAEIDVLSGFGEVRPKILVVENCFGISGQESIRDQVISMGYTIAARITYVDDVYIRNDLKSVLEKVASIKTTLSRYFY